MARVVKAGPQSEAAGTPYPLPVRTAIYGAVFLAAAGIGAVLSDGLLRLPYATFRSENVSVEIETLSQENPGVGAMFTALKVHYPETYEALTKRIAIAIRGGDANGARTAAFEATRQLSDSKLSFIASASPEKLHDWGKSALAVMNATRRDAPELCAQIAFGTIKRDAATFAPSVANAVGRHAAAAIAAIRDGELAPHDYDAPGPAEQTIFARTVAAQGVSNREAQSLNTEGGVRGLPEVEQCALGIKLLRGVVATPEPIRSRILSMMAAKATRQQ